MNITPLFDNILVESIEAETQTSSGILLPDNSKDKSQEGVVIAVGTGKIHPDGKIGTMVVSKGDKVMYKEWGGTKVKIDGKDMILLSQEEILAKVS